MVTLAGVSKVYGRGGAAVRALDQVSLTAAQGEFTCLIRASGCGKSTLLNLVAGLDAAGMKQAWAFTFHALVAGELIVIIANRPSLGVLLSSDQDQADMTSTVAIMIVFLIIGIAVDALSGVANKAIRRRWGLEQVSLRNSCSIGVFAGDRYDIGVT